MSSTLSCNIKADYYYFIIIINTKSEQINKLWYIIIG